MPTPVPRGGSPYKVSMLFNQGAIGWSTQCYFASSTDKIEDVKAASLNLAYALRNLLSDWSGLVGIRITEMKPGGATIPVPGQEIGVGGGFPEDAEYPAKSWLVSISDPTSTYRRKLYVRGMVTPHNTYKPNNQFKPPIPTAFRSKFDLVSAILRNTAVGPNATSQYGFWVIRAWDKSTTTRKEYGITSLELDPTWQTYTIRVQGNPVIFQGDEARIKGVRGPGTEGVNGLFKVLAPGTNNAGVTVIVTNKLKRCPGNPIMLQPGKLILAERKYYDIATVSADRIVTRKTGRAFFVPRGAQRNNAC